MPTIIYKLNNKYLYVILLNIKFYDQTKIVFYLVKKYDTETNKFK